jgi:hypothetical protein
MRILASIAAAVALLMCVPAALAHQGSPNFLSQVNATPDGVTVTVLNRDDRLLLQNTSSRDVLVEGYENEPYARIDADGTVAVNTNSEAYYLNEERDGQVDVPASAEPGAPPEWEEISKSGRFEWHDHRMHWMAEADPAAVKDKSARTKVFDWEVPLQVGGSPAAISGTLFWTPVETAGLPLPAIFAFAALVVVLCIAVIVVRRRRTDSLSTKEAW